MRNVVLRWAEHEDPNKQFEAVKLLKYIPDYQFERKFLTRALKYTGKGTISKTFLIKSLKHSLHQHLDIELLVPLEMV